MTNKLLYAAAIGAIAVGVSAAGPAYAECNIVDRDLDQTVRANAESRSVYHDQIVRDLRQLRNAATILANYGRDDACQEVADTIKEMTNDPQAAVKARRDGIAEGEIDTNVSWQEIEAARIAAAKPVSEFEGRLRVDQLIGTDVRDRSGESVGEVEDVLLGTADRESYAIITHGGFLGIGEEQVAVPFDKLKMASDESAIYVTMSREQIESAPAFDRGKFEWVDDEAWRSSNDEYYSTL